MSKTQAQLVNRAAIELKVLGAGQSLSAEDQQFLDDEVTPLMSDLASRNIWQWGDPDDIDEAAFVHLAKLLANSVAGAFGVQPDENVRKLSESRLRQLEPPSLSGQPLKTVYY